VVKLESQTAPQTLYSEIKWSNYLLLDWSGATSQTINLTKYQNCTSKN